MNKYKREYFSKKKYNKSAKKYNKSAKKKYNKSSRRKIIYNRSTRKKYKSKNKHKKSYINKILYGGAGGGHVDDRWRGICFRANKQKKALTDPEFEYLQQLSSAGEYTDIHMEKRIKDAIMNETRRRAEAAAWRAAAAADMQRRDGGEERWRSICFRVNQGKEALSDADFKYLQQLYFAGEFNDIHMRGRIEKAIKNETARRAAVQLSEHKDDIGEFGSIVGGKWVNAKPPVEIDMVKEIAWKKKQKDAKAEWEKKNGIKSENTLKKPVKMSKEDQAIFDRAQKYRVVRGLFIKERQLINELGLNVEEGLLEAGINPNDPYYKGWVKDKRDALLEKLQLDPGATWEDIKAKSERTIIEGVDLSKSELTSSQVVNNVKEAYADTYNHNQEFCQKYGSELKRELGRDFMDINPQKVEEHRNIKEREVEQKEGKKMLQLKKELLNVMDYRERHPPPPPPDRKKTSGLELTGTDKAAMPHLKDAFKSMRAGIEGKSISNSDDDMDFEQDFSDSDSD